MIRHRKFRPLERAGVLLISAVLAGLVTGCEEPPEGGVFQPGAPPGETAPAAEPAEAVPEEAVEAVEATEDAVSEAAETVEEGAEEAVEVDDPRERPLPEAGEAVGDPDPGMPQDCCDP